MNCTSIHNSLTKLRKERLNSKTTATSDAIWCTLGGLFIGTVTGSYIDPVVGVTVGTGTFGICIVESIVPGAKDAEFSRQETKLERELQQCYRNEKNYKH